MVTVVFNAEPRHLVESMEVLDVLLAKFDQQPRFELWLSVGDEGPFVCMLRNGQHAYLMHLRFPGDAGVVSGRSSQAEESIAYTLSNGQVDTYPASWCIPVEQCFKALGYFFLHAGARDECVPWCEG